MSGTTGGKGATTANRRTGAIEPFKRADGTSTTVARFASRMGRANTSTLGPSCFDASKHTRLFKRSRLRRIRPAGCSPKSAALPCPTSRRQSANGQRPGCRRARRAAMRRRVTMRADWSTTCCRSSATERSPHHLRATRFDLATDPGRRPAEDQAAGRARRLHHDRGLHPRRRGCSRWHRGRALFTHRERRSVGA